MLEPVLYHYIQGIFDYFPHLSAQQKKQFTEMGSIYQDWNSKLNLISRKDIQYVYLKHVLHSLSIAKLLSFNPTTQILDMGTGGGFPGIPLAIMFPAANFHLVDSIAKKIQAVQKISQELGLNNVTTEVARAENLQKKFDFIVGRGVTNLALFYQWSKHLIAVRSNHRLPNVVLYLT